MQLQAELYPRKNPRGLRIWGLLEDGSRVKLYERKGMGELIGLGKVLLSAIVPGHAKGCVSKEGAAAPRKRQRVLGLLPTRRPVLVPKTQTMDKSASSQRVRDQHQKATGKVIDAKAEVVG